MSVITRKKSFEEIVNRLRRDEELPVIVLGCDKCAKLNETGGTPQVKEMKERLKEVGFKIMEIEGLPEAIEEGLCDPQAVKKNVKKVTGIDMEFQMLILSCGAGLKCVRDIISSIGLVPGLETLGPGVKGELACLACGDCQFDIDGCKMLKLLDDQVNRLKQSYAKSLEKKLGGENESR